MKENTTTPNVELVKTENETQLNSSSEVVSETTTEVVTPKPTTANQSETKPESGLPMKKETLSLIVIFLLGFVVLLGVLLINELRKPSISAASTEVIEIATTYELPTPNKIGEVIELPEPSFTGDISVEEAIKSRRSKRVYSNEPVTLSELSQILWSAQGLTDDKGHRAAPSARGVYPFNLYVVVRNAEGVDAGLYLYDPETHTLGDLGLASAGEMLSSAGVQDTSKKAPVVIAMAASYAKAAEKFPDNPEAVTLIEAGHIGQNIYLQTEAMEMATVVTAGFSSEKVSEALGLDPVEDIIYLVPFGHVGEEVETE